MTDILRSYAFTITVLAVAWAAVAVVMVTLFTLYAVAGPIVAGAVLVAGIVAVEGWALS